MNNPLRITDPNKIIWSKILIGKRSQCNPLELTLYFEEGGRLEYYPKGFIKEEFLDNYKKITESWYLLK